MVDQLDPEVANTALSYSYLIAVGGILLVSGFSFGFLLNIGAILVLSVLCSGAVFLIALGTGAPLVASLILAATTPAILQIGYFLGILFRRTTRDAAASEAVSPQKSNSR